MECIGAKLYTYFATTTAEKKKNVNKNGVFHESTSPQIAQPKNPKLTQPNNQRKSRQTLYHPP